MPFTFSSFVLLPRNDLAVNCEAFCVEYAFVLAVILLSGLFRLCGEGVGPCRREGERRGEVDMEERGDRSTKLGGELSLRLQVLYSLPLLKS